MKCATWVDGRLVLLGDAAHAMEPTLGQGANSAMVDAAFLARVLTDAPDLDRALARYDLTRRPVVTDVQRDATRIAKMARLRNGARPLGPRHRASERPAATPPPPRSASASSSRCRPDGRPTLDHVALRVGIRPSAPRRSPSRYPTLDDGVGG